MRHRTASPCAGPVMNVERSHKFGDQQQRSLRARSSTPTLVQKNAHMYQGERTIKSDLSSMQGPIYNSGKATKHNFSGGYVAPKARTDQQELVNKFFKHDKSEIVKSEQSMSIQTKTESRMESKIESKVEFSSGEERRKEALEQNYTYCC